MQYFITLSLLAPLVLATPTGQRRDLDTCGVRGYNKGGDVFQTTSSQDAATCGAFCKQVTACQSFTVGPSGCTLYSGTSDYTADASSPNVFYGKLCTNYASTSSSSSSSTTSSAASTTTTPATSNSGSGVCGAVGYDKSSPEAYESSEKAADATRAGCAALCKAQSQCKGYAYGSGTCLLYASTFSKNLDKESSSPYTFYDASCAGGSTATTTTPAAASTTPTTTASTKKCAVAGVEKSSASDSIVGFKFKPSAGCSKFCAGKSASSFEAYYDYCICFSKSVASVADAKSGAAGVFSDISC